MSRCSLYRWQEKSTRRSPLSPHLFINTASGRKERERKKEASSLAEKREDAAALR